MLEAFRKASKTWSVKLLFGLLVLSFLAWGVGDVVRGGFGGGPAIAVGKTEIPAAEVNAELKREVDRLQPLFGGKLSVDEAKKLGLMDRTIETIVTRTLIDEAGRRLGLAASDEAVLKQIAENPAFRNQLGQFDRDLLRRALSRAGLSEEGFLRMERANLIRSQMAEGLMGGVAAPNALVQPLVRHREERRQAEAVQIKDDSVPLPAAPDAAALEEYYKKNGQRFMAPELRALTILLLRASEVAAQVQVTPEMVAEAYQQRLDEFTTPERRVVSQIVLADQAEADKAADLQRQGKDLAAIAKAMGQSPIDLGTVEKRDLPDELAEAVFALPAGATGAPVHSALGWHVAKVTSVSPGRTRSLAEVKGQLEQDLRRDKAHDQLAEVANQVEDALGGGATLEEVSQRLKLKLVKVPAMDAQGRAPNGKPVAEAPKGEQFLEVAFRTDQGTESQLTEIEGEGYFLLRVDQVTPPAPKPFAEIKGEVAAAWQAEQRHEAARKKAEDVAARLKAGEPAAKVAQAVGGKALTPPAFTRDGAETAQLPAPVVAELFKGSPGAVAVAPSQGGFVVARLDKVLPVEAAAQAEAVNANRQRISGAVSNDLVDQFIAALNAEIGVKVDRSQLMREE